MEVIITGTGSGIGRALAEFYLAQGANVVGVSRSNSIAHPNFVFVKKDLLNEHTFDWLKSVVSFQRDLVVINNAGMIGNLERISEQDGSDIEEVLTLNTIRPMQLCQFVLKELPLSIPLTIINISSGAAKRPIAGWASYCSSKAAIDLFSQTIAAEEKERGRQLVVYSLAPGVVDTPMQEKIRSADTNAFSDVEHFKKLHADGQLISLNELIVKFERLIKKPYDGKVIQTLRDY